MSKPSILFPGSVKCKRPKMTDKKGATWDHHDIFDTKGYKHCGYLDTSWGQYFYFQFGTQWRKAKIALFMHGYDNTVYFANQESK